MFKSNIFSMRKIIEILHRINLLLAFGKTIAVFLSYFIGAVMAIGYLSFYSFSLPGLIISVFLLDVICMLIKVPDNGKIATITLIIILIVSKTSPNLSPITNGLLRFIESAVGTTIGIGMVWSMNTIKKRTESKN